MRKIIKNVLRLYLTIIIPFLLFEKANAQNKTKLKSSKIYASYDLTQLGKQVRIAYDFYDKKNRYIGFSIAQAGGVYQNFDKDAYYYDLAQSRINISFRFTNYLYSSKRWNIFGLGSAGLSYNPILEAPIIILPSLHLGMGIDFKIINESGIRFEAGYGSPYAASIGYFFRY